MRNIGGVGQDHDLMLLRLATAMIMYVRLNPSPFQRLRAEAPIFVQVFNAKVRYWRTSTVDSRHADCIPL